MPTSESASTPSFLPNFCSIPVVFVVVICAELLAFVLTLFSTYDLMNRLDRLAMTSLFIQWNALTCAALLCILRRWLPGPRHWRAALASLAAIILVSYLVSEIAWMVLNFGARQTLVTHFSRAQFVARNVAIAALVGALSLHYCYVHYQFRRRVESESAARIQALQSRIRPHFLFNSMNTIASLTRSRPETAEQVVEDLADLFRASLADARNRVSLREELELAERYLRIEGLRLGHRMELDWQVDALPGDALIPALMVQPLLENAIYHGIEPQPDGGRVAVRGHRDGDCIEIHIENPLPPANAAALRPDGNSLAQDNVRQRLIAHFGAKGRLNAGPVGDIYRATLRFPYQHQRL
jgi:two-component system sensor histidine kinase AlgZ